MELLNATKMKAAYTMGMKPDGRELLVVVVKGTFKIPNDPNQKPELADEQADLVMADEFTGEPGFSAPIYESDFAPMKPRCDVILNGTAYAPQGKLMAHVPVALRVGSMRKAFNVVGNRVWRLGLFGVVATIPEPFLTMPISYDNAFGGVDNSHENPKRHAALAENPVGRGFHVNMARDAIEGKPLPNTEAAGRAVRSPRVKYRPMAFGPVGRNWQPRQRYGGTYDQNWIDNVFPFLPADFDNQYYQCAPKDQQLDRLNGGEEVVLFNLTPRGQTRFRLPMIEVPVTFYRKNGGEVATGTVLDTLVIEPDLNRFMLAWRIALPLKRNMFEIEQVVVGRMTRAWYRARQLGKAYYSSLEELLSERRAQREEAQLLEEIES